MEIYFDGVPAAAPHFRPCPTLPTWSDIENQKCRPRKPATSVQKLFPHPVFVADIFGSLCRLMSGRVGSVISESGMVENVGVAAGTASKYISVLKLFLLPVLVAAILNFRCRPMSGHVVSAISVSGVVKNVGVAVGIASPSLYIFPFNRYFHFRFHGRHFEFRMSADVGPCRQCHV